MNQPAGGGPKQRTQRSRAQHGGVLARTTIGLPDALAERLDRARERFDVSRVCAAALERELQRLNAPALDRGGDRSERGSRSPAALPRPLVCGSRARPRGPGAGEVRAWSPSAGPRASTSRRRGMLGLGRLRVAGAVGGARYPAAPRQPAPGTHRTRLQIDGPIAQRLEQSLIRKSRGCSAPWGLIRSLVGRVAPCRGVPGSSPACRRDSPRSPVRSPPVPREVGAAPIRPPN